MTPLPASQTSDRHRRHASGAPASGRTQRFIALVVSLLLLAAGAGILIDSAPRARDYRLIASGVDVHGTPTSCTVETTPRGQPRAVLTLAYMSPGGRFTTEEHTRHVTCAEALGEHSAHRVLYAASRPSLALPLADAFALRIRLISTIMGAFIFTLLGLWGLSRLVRGMAKRR